MTATIYHAESSARIFGGTSSDYLHIHQWMDATKEHFCDFRHRAMRHHSEGIAECVRIFGPTIVNSDGKKIPTAYVAEQHAIEDLGKVPCLADWLKQIDPKPWMARATRTFKEAHGVRRGE